MKTIRWGVIGCGDATAEVPADNPPHVHQPLIQSIVDELNGIGACTSTGQTAARTAWVTDQNLHDFRAAKGTAGRNAS
jgi:hypothetical protein